jgi:phosphoglycolate phosphatase
MTRVAADRPGSEPALPRLSVLVFDWDGTLIDSIPRIVRCFRETFSSLGLPTPSSRSIKRLVGKPLQESFEILLRELAAEKDAKADALVDRYRSIWLGPQLALSPLFDGVAELLQRLSELGFELALATGKSREGFERESNLYAMRDFFGHTICAGEQPGKPSPDMLHHLARAYARSESELLMIGDSTLDMEMARRAGCAAAAVATGGSAGEELMAHQPLTVFDSILELEPWLAGRR